jgi:hypothetical protein
MVGKPYRITEGLPVVRPESGPKLLQELA